MIKQKENKHIKIAGLFLVLLMALILNINNINAAEDNSPYVSFEVRDSNDNSTTKKTGDTFKDGGFIYITVASINKHMIDKITYEICDAKTGDAGTSDSIDIGGTLDCYTIFTQAKDFSSDEKDMEIKVSAFLSSGEKFNYSNVFTCLPNDNNNKGTNLYGTPIITWDITPKDRIAKPNGNITWDIKVTNDIPSDGKQYNETKIHGYSIKVQYKDSKESIYSTNINSSIFELDTLKGSCALSSTLKSEDIELIISLNLSNGNTENKTYSFQNNFLSREGNVNVTEYYRKTNSYYELTNKQTLNQGDLVKIDLKSDSSYDNIKTCNIYLEDKEDSKSKETIHQNNSINKNSYTYEFDIDVPEGSYYLITEGTTNNGGKYSSGKEIKVLRTSGSIPLIENEITIDTTKNIKPGDEIKSEIKLGLSDLSFKNITVKVLDANRKELMTTNKSFDEGMRTVSMTHKSDANYKLTKYILKYSITTHDNQSYETEKTVNVTQNGQVPNGDIDVSKVKNKIYTGVINKAPKGVAFELWNKDDDLFYKEGESVNLIGYYVSFTDKTCDEPKLTLNLPSGLTLTSATINDKKQKVTTSGNKNVITLEKMDAQILYELDLTFQVTKNVTKEERELIEAIFVCDNYTDRSSMFLYFYDEGYVGTNVSFITGYPDGTFRPDNNITREEVATMIARALKLTNTKENIKFSDLHKSNWSYNYVMECYNEGIINGYPDGSFKPKDNITRGELYAMIYRLTKLNVDNETCIFVPSAYDATGNKWETYYLANLDRLKMTGDLKSTTASIKASRMEVVIMLQRILFRNPGSIKLNFTDVKSSYYGSYDITGSSNDYTFERDKNGREIIKKNK